MTEERISFDISIRDACCLNNAMRREIEIGERRRSEGGLTADWEEYLHQLHSCLQVLMTAFEEAIGEKPTTR